MRAPLMIWTVYERPSDYPIGFVARRFEIRADGSAVATLDAHYAGTLEAVRAKLPPSLHCLGREAGDEPAIVESWL